MKDIILFCLLLCALQPSDARYIRQCTIHGYYYNKGKLIATETFPNGSIMTSSGISNSHFFIDKKLIKADSLIFKIE